MCALNSHFITRNKIFGNIPTFIDTNLRVIVQKYINQS